MNCINFAYFDFSPRFLVEEGGGVVGDERDLVNNRSRLLKTAFNSAFPRIWHVG